MSFYIIYCVILKSGLLKGTKLVEFADDDVVVTIAKHLEEITTTTSVSLSKLFDNSC